MREPRGNGVGPKRPKVRCAIYTRKSSEEGLEQAFNSLDAQREACEAFILSQRHEGWDARPEMYDDGGFSGGTVDRPGLQRLLADIADGRVDVVVVYKVDRLTRSLSDFARIVDIFDRKSVSIVSVTQQFNTTTSMGRLTLNVLLSFAQFEREVTGERIRDKIAASKKKGMWMGGFPPLGYDARDRKLLVNEAESATVRHIFRCYRELRSVRLLKEELDADGIVSKVRQRSDGTVYGGKPLARGALYLMLQNPIYRGMIAHKGQAYPGEHQPIVDEEVWNEVQTILKGNRVERQSGGNPDQPSLLAGLIYDAYGERMTPTHAVKKGTRYRYYISKPLVTGARKQITNGQRVPAASLEAIVTSRVRSCLAEPIEVLNAIQASHLNAGTQKRLLDGARQCAESWDRRSPDEIRAMLVAFVTRIQVHPDRVEISLDPTRLAAVLTGGLEAPDFSAASAAAHPDPIMLTIPARLKRTGMEMRMVLDGPPTEASPSTSLMKLIVSAHQLKDALVHSGGLSMEEIAQQKGFSPSYAARLIRLAFLSPDLTTAILAGKQPPEMTARRLMADTRLPLAWREQRAALGLA